MPEPFITEPEVQTAILIGVADEETNEQSVHEYLDELAFLAYTAGILPEKKFIQKLKYPDPRTFVGAGKINEIKNYILENGSDLVIVA